MRQIFFLNLGTFEGKDDKLIFDVGKFTAEHSGRGLNSGAIDE